MSYNNYVICVFGLFSKLYFPPYIVFVFLFRSPLFYNKYVLFICTCFYVYKYVYSWAYCPMYKEIKCKTVNCKTVLSPTLSVHPYNSPNCWFLQSKLKGQTYFNRVSVSDDDGESNAILRSIYFPIILFFYQLYEL